MLTVELLVKIPNFWYQLLPIYHQFWSYFLPQFYTQFQSEFLPSSISILALHTTSISIPVNSFDPYSFHLILPLTLIF